MISEARMHTNQSRLAAIPDSRTVCFSEGFAPLVDQGFDEVA